MLSPLSLLDYPGMVFLLFILFYLVISHQSETKGVDEIYVRVDGELPLDSKK
jgi:hypothetical protein